MDTLAMVQALKALGVVRATFSVEGELTSFELGPDTLPSPPPDLDPPPETPDDITKAANRLMGRSAP